MVDQGLDQVGARVEGVPLEGAEPDIGGRQPHQHRSPRRAGLIGPLQGLARLDQGEGPAGWNAQGLQHLAGQHLPHPALEGQPAVGGARPGGAARALGPEVEQPAAPRLAHLGEQEAAAVAEVWVVDPELMAVIARGQGFGLVLGQGLEAAEGGDPLRVRQRVEPHRPGGAVVAESDDALGKRGGLDLVGELRPEGHEPGIRPIVGRNRHAGADGAEPRRGQARQPPLRRGPPFARAAPGRSCGRKPGAARCRPPPCS